MKRGPRFSGKSCKKSYVLKISFIKENTPHLEGDNHSGERRSRNQERSREMKLSQVSGNDLPPGSDFIRNQESFNPGSQE